MLRLRAPSALFGILSLTLFAFAGLATAVGLLGATGGYVFPHAQALMWPAAMATFIAGASIGPRLRKGLIRDRRDLIMRGAITGAIIGFAWPLSFAASAAMDAQNVMIVAQSALPIGAGIVIGAIAGAVGAACASLAATTR